MATQPASPFAAAQPGAFGRTFATAQDWQLHSGIVQSGGGVARYYRSDRKVYAPVSNEITGYYVSSMLHAHETSADSRYLNRAAESARYLVHGAWDRSTGTFPFEPTGSDGAGFTYFFDSGIILRALVSMWEATDDQAYLNRANETAETMWNDFVDEGRIHPILSLPDKCPVPQTARWSTSSGCYQLKAALGWNELGHATGRRKWRDRYLYALRSCLAGHEEFIDSESQDPCVMDRLHAYCYFLEGLFPAITEQTRYAGQALAALRYGTRFAGQCLRNVSPVLLRSDVCAQLVRVRLKAEALGFEALDQDHVVEEVAMIRSFQAQHADRRIDGGFYFGREGNTPRPFINPVSTAFCVQALSMWDEYCSGELGRETSKLI